MTRKTTTETKIPAKRGRRAYTADEREQILLEVARLYKMKFSQGHIATVLGKSPSTISDCIKELRKRWIEEQKHLTEEAIAEQVACHEMIYNEALQAWETAKKPVVIMVKETGVTPKGEIDKTVERIEPPRINPGLLTRASDSLKQIAALQGLPVHIEYTDINKALEAVKKAGFEVKEADE
jgi:biotin operon repressor